LLLLFATRNSFSVERTKAAHKQKRQIEKKRTNEEETNEEKKRKQKLRSHAKTRQPPSVDS
jgi:hypothetical protein